MPPICRLHGEVVWECLICREAWFKIDELTELGRLREGYAMRFIAEMKEVKGVGDDDNFDAE